MRATGLVAWISGAAIAAVTPSVALACPTCIAANEANRDAFLGTTVLLSLVPLAMFGGFLAYLLYRAVQRASVADRVVAPEPLSGPTVDPAQSSTVD